MHVKLVSDKKRLAMRNDVLDSFAISFIKNHFDEIDLKKVEWNVKTKKQAIKDIKDKDYMAGWVITEVMQWGTPTDYLKDISVEMDEENHYFVVKIDDRYFALDYTKKNHYFYEVFPRKVVVEKLVFDGVDKRDVDGYPCDNNPYKHIDNKEDYDKLLVSGMFWEFYPELSGIYDIDKEVIKQNNNGTRMG